MGRRSSSNLSSVHDKTSHATGNVTEWEADFEDINLEETPSIPLSVSTSKNDDDDDDDEASLSSLAMIRQVVRSLAIMPPSVRMRDSLSPSNSSAIRPRSMSPRRSSRSCTDPITAQQQHQAEADRQGLTSEHDDEIRSHSGQSLPRNFFSPQRSLIFDAMELSFDEEDDENGDNGQHLFSPTTQTTNDDNKDTPSLPDTESITNSDDSSITIPPVPKHLQEFHFRWWGHGMGWTVIGIAAAVLGSALAVLSRQSTQFTNLGEPMNVAPIYQAVDALGLLQFKVCYNETIVPQTGCQVFDLKSDDVDDVMFEVSRILLTVSAFMGFLLTICLCTTAAWESINLKPVGLGFLLVYFCQAFAMLFFDSDICHEHECRIGTGCIQCLIASGCWIIAGLATAKMDTQKTRLRRRRRRRAKRHVQKAEKQAAAAAKRLSKRNSSSSSSSETDKTSSNGSVLNDLEQLEILSPK